MPPKKAFRVEGQPSAPEAVGTGALASGAAQAQANSTSTVPRKLQTARRGGRTGGAPARTQLAKAKKTANKTGESGSTLPANEPIPQTLVSNPNNLATPSTKPAKAASTQTPIPPIPVQQKTHEQSMNDAPAITPISSHDQTERLSSVQTALEDMASSTRASHGEILRLRTDLRVVDEYTRKIDEMSIKIRTGLQDLENREHEREHSLAALKDTLQSLLADMKTVNPPFNVESAPAAVTPEQAMMTQQKEQRAPVVQMQDSRNARSGIIGDDDSFTLPADPMSLDEDEDLLRPADRQAHNNQSTQSSAALPVALDTGTHQPEPIIKQPESDDGLYYVSDEDANVRRPPSKSTPLQAGPKTVVKTSEKRKSKQGTSVAEPVNKRPLAASSPFNNPDPEELDLASMPAGGGYGGVPSPNVVKSNSSIKQQERAGEVMEAVQDEFAALPRVQGLRLPSSPVVFPDAYINSALFGIQSTEEHGITFSKIDRRMRDKQVFSCPELIKIHPDVHEYAPLPGYNGALTMVDGQEGQGEVGERYPVFRRKALSRGGHSRSSGQALGWEYAGEYKVARRKIVPLEVWHSWTEDRREDIVARMHGTAWGQELLVRKMIDRPNLTEQDLLTYFGRKPAPNLRMNWTLLQCVDWNHGQYDKLVAAFQEWQDKDTGMDSKIGGQKTAAQFMADMFSVTSGTEGEEDDDAISIDSLEPTSPNSTRRIITSLPGDDDDDEDDEGEEDAVKSQVTTVPTSTTAVPPGVKVQDQDQGLSPNTLTRKRYRKDSSSESSDEDYDKELQKHSSVMEKMFGGKYKVGDPNSYFKTDKTLSGKAKGATTASAAAASASAPVTAPVSGPPSSSANNPKKDNAKKPTPNKRPRLTSDITTTGIGALAKPSTPKTTTGTPTNSAKKTGPANATPQVRVSSSATTTPRAGTTTSSAATKKNTAFKLVGSDTGPAGIGTGIGTGNRIIIGNGNQRTSLQKQKPTTSRLSASGAGPGSGLGGLGGLDALGTSSGTGIGTGTSNGTGNATKSKSSTSTNHRNSILDLYANGLANNSTSTSTLFNTPGSTPTSTLGYGQTTPTGLNGNAYSNFPIRANSPFTFTSTGPAHPSAATSSFTPLAYSKPASSSSSSSTPRAHSNTSSASSSTSTPPTHARPTSASVFNGPIRARNPRPTTPVQNNGNNTKNTSVPDKEDEITTSSRGRRVKKVDYGMLRPEFRFSDNEEDEVDVVRPGK